MTVGTAGGPGLPDGRYADPTLRPDGTMVAIQPRCWGAESCPRSPIDGDAVVRVDQASGDAVSTILGSSTDPQVQLFGLVVDPSGHRLAVEGRGGSTGTTDLYEITGGRLHLVAGEVTAAGWLPHLRQQHASLPNRTTPGRPGSARGRLAGY